MIRHSERRYHSGIATPDQDRYLFVVRLNFAPKSGDRRHSGIHRMVERAAPHRRSVKPEAANGGGPKGQALQTDGGEQTIELAIGQCTRVGGGASGASPWSKLFAISVRIVKTVDAHFD